jgi:ABC-2 type transport system ATP-binding protein
LDSDRVEELARRLDLDLDRPVGQLSKGNRQKIGLVLAFAPRARVLLLDEPTSGLDPLLQREFASLVAEAVRDGSGIVLSSHVLSELEGLADRVAVMRGGSLIAIESIADLRQRATTTIRIQLSSSEQAQRFASTLPQERAQAAVEADSQWVSVHFSGDIDSILKHAASFYVCSMESHFGELDEVLMGFYSDSEQP